MNELIKLKTYKTRLEASVDMSYLKYRGIESFIEADDLGGAYSFPFQPSSSGVQLKVFKKDFDKAKKLLEEIDQK